MKILEQIQATKYHVLQIEPGGSDTISASCSIFKTAGGKLDLIERIDNSQLNEVLKGIPRKSAIILLILGEQVLTRYSSAPGPGLFEEIDEDDFYIQKNLASDGHSLESACRRKIIDDVLGLFNPDKYFVLEVLVGPGCLIELEELVQNEHIGSGHFQFDFKQGRLHLIHEKPEEEITQTARISEDKEEVEVAGTIVKRSGLLSLSAMLQFLKGSPEGFPILKEQNTQFGYFRRLRKVAFGAIGLLFVLLLINFLLFSGARSELMQLKSSGENHVSLVKEINQLQAQINEYKRLASFEISAPHKTYSFYLDDLARTRASGIWFNTLKLHPSFKKAEKNKVIEFDPSLILLQGEAKDPVSLNAFTGRLKQHDWVEDIELLHYEKALEKTYADFELRIKKKK